MLFQPLGTQSPSREALWNTRTGRLVGGRWILSFLLGLQGSLAAAAVHRHLATPALAVALGLALTNLAHGIFEPLRRKRGYPGEELFLAVQLVLDAGLLGGLAAASGHLASPFLPLLLGPAFAAVLLVRAVLAGSVVLVALLLPATSAISAAGPGADVANAVHGPWYALASLGCALAYCVPVCRGALRFQEARPGDQVHALPVPVAEPEAARPAEQESLAGAAERSRQFLIVELAAPIARQIREPLGILRARAESLRLRMAAAPSLAEAQGDLRVLLGQLDVLQRILRGVLSFLPAERVAGRVNLEELCASELLRVGIDAQRVQRVGLRKLPEVEGSHEELELAIGLVLRLASRHALPGSRLRWRCRVRPEGTLRLELRFPAEPGLFRGAQPSEDREELATYLRLAILHRILDKHGGSFHLVRRAAGVASLEGILPCGRAPGGEESGAPPRGRVATGLIE